MSRSFLASSSFTLGIALLVACGDSAGGGVDAGDMDAGGMDAGGALDGAARDTGGGMDGAAHDGPGDPDSGNGAVSDSDGDGIADVDEGAESAVDTDDDGTPDFQDDDSDNDGILDADEAGDRLADTPPADTDGDGTPDFRDLDSDGNGVPDADEGVGDTDGDGAPDFQDTDNDGDGIDDIAEIVGGAADCDMDGVPDADGSADVPRDCDGDGTPDYLTPDADGDTISDGEEGLDVDTDGDGFLDRYDADSDDDGLADSLEAGDADIATAAVDTDGDTVPDFRDPDSDNDGLTDRFEGENGTNPYDADSDMDGATDLVEVTAGTDPTNGSDNPQANGDFVFTVPYQAAPTPTDQDLEFATDLQMVDVYLLIDRSASMDVEWNAIRDSIQAVANNVTCSPGGSGQPGQCIPDIWWGSGTVGYTQHEQAYTHLRDMEVSPTAVSAIGVRTEPPACCDEALNFATWAALTGGGGADSGCLVSPAGPRTSCLDSPAGVGGLGYPCFRPSALPVILLATDEAPTMTYNCPTLDTVIAAANAIGAKIIGIRGNSSSTQLTADLNALASGTGAVDAMNNPLVMNGSDANAAAAIEQGIRALASGVRFDLSTTPIDDPSDAVDAVAAFVDHLETLQLGTAACTDGLTDRDTNADGTPDEFVQVLTGTPVCWRLVPRQNTTVQATAEPQLFRATIQVLGDSFTFLGEREVFFLVPANGDPTPRPVGGSMDGGVGDGGGLDAGP